MLAKVSQIFVFYLQHLTSKILTSITSILISSGKFLSSGSDPLPFREISISKHWVPSLAFKPFRVKLDLSNALRLERDLSSAQRASVAATHLAITSLLYSIVSFGV